MANTASAEKRHRQTLKRRARNRAATSSLRTAIKKVRKALAASDVETAEKLLPDTLSMIDSAASKRIIHPNAAARHKSRLVRAVREAARPSA